MLSVHSGALECTRDFSILEVRSFGIGRYAV